MTISPMYPSVDTLFKNQINPCTLSCSSFHKTIYSCFDAAVLEKIIKQCPKEINKFSSRFKLTPLHLATIAGNQDATKLLLDNGAEINKHDYKQFTALAHAAMKGDLDLVSLYKQYNARTDLITSTGASYEDYLKLNRLEERQTCSIESPCDSLDIKATVAKPCLGNDVEWINEIVITPQQLVNIWQSPAAAESMLDKIESKLLENYYSASIQRYRKNPPELSVETILVDDLKRPLPMNICGLVAKTSIKEGEIIAEYLGEWIEEKKFQDDNLSRKISDEYVMMKNIDGRKYRGYGAMANDGFPNALTHTFTNSAGLTRTFLVASEDINPGDQITIDYLDEHSLKTQKRMEMRPAALLRFARQEWSDKNWFKKLKETTTSIEKVSEPANASKFSKWIYLFTTPASLLILIEDGVATSKKISELQQVFPGMQSLNGIAKIAREYEALVKRDQKFAKDFIDRIKQKHFI